MIDGSTGSTPRDCAGGPSMRISDECLVFINLFEWFVGKGIKTY